MIKTAIEIVENNKLITIMKEHSLSPDLVENIEGIILMDSTYFEKDQLNEKDVARISRQSLMKLIEELYQNIPESHISEFEDKYEKGDVEDY